MALMRIRWLNKRIITLAAALILVMLLTVVLASRRPIGNYSDPAGPIFEGSYADEQGHFTGSLRVVTWNLHYGEKLEQVISVLENAEELQGADVLLLQEVDIEGVETIARRLHYNYVFYPAAMHRQRRKEYGNAILSIWSLSEPAKIVLPNALPGWLESRNAVRAILTIDGRQILAYSVHLDTTWIIFSRGISQGEFMAEEAGREHNFVILGGDFNTWNRGSISILEERLGKAGLERLTKGTGYTFEYSGLKLTLDHIFSGDVVDYQAGVYRQTDASDHYPLWAEMSIKIAE